MSENKATQGFNNLMSKYMEDDDMVRDFCFNYVNPNNIMTYSYSVTRTTSDIKASNIDLKSADPLDPFGARLYKLNHQLKQLPHKLEDLDIDDDDLVIINDNNYNCKTLTWSDVVESYEPYLARYLCDDTDIKFQIKWILKHKRISDNKLGHKIGLLQQQINYFKNGKRDIGNMTLNTALKLRDYYRNEIFRKFGKGRESL